MKLQKTSSDKFDERIKHYKEKSLAHLKLILPKWAYGNNCDNMLDLTLHPKEEEYFIFLVDTNKLIKSSEFHEVNPTTLFTGERLNDGRVAMILHRWDNNQFVDPPTVEIFDKDKSKLYFSDGRHRSKTSYLFGHTQIPIAVHNSQINSINKILKLIPHTT